MPEDSQLIKHHTLRLAEMLQSGFQPLPCNSFIDFSKTLIFIAEGGGFSYFDDRILGHLYAPAFIGLAFMFNSRVTHKAEFMATRHARIYSINFDDARHLLERHQGYQSVCYLLARSIQQYSEYSMLHKTTSSSYQLVKAAIESYGSLAGSLSDSISLSSYVIQVTGVSKSRVMYILQELKKGKYITFNTEDKRLIINKLPERF